ncbi:MAG TPA: DUF6438 domain-containing protein [Longimicrobiales bacterium]|nr:DUF6438 domain-containing protein [Longimicrobiales bacterium]
MIRLAAIPAVRESSTREAIPTERGSSARASIAAARKHSTREAIAALALVAAAGTVAACSPAQNGAADGANQPAAVVSAGSRITMQRMPCFGTCPVYTVDITADGTVSFTGERFVDSTGTRTAAIAPDSAAALMQELIARGFHDFADRYTHEAKECGSYHTDAPRVILTLRAGGRLKTVEHDYGCSDAPDELRALQERVDSVAGVKRWVGGQ